MNYFRISVLLVFILLIYTTTLNIVLITQLEDKIISYVFAQSNINKINSQSADYYVRFNCGTIDNDNGPLRPGKYDSDITVFNRQSFPLTIIWKSIEIDQQNKENFQIINIQPQSIVNINCAKIFSSSLIQNSLLNNKFIEGIVLIRINTDNGQLTNNFLNNQGSSIIIDNQKLENLVNVDVLHTVNTLSDLNKQAFILKVDFTLSHQEEKTNSQKENNDNLTAIFSVDPKSIIDPAKLVKDMLNNNSTTNYKSSNNATIRIINSQLLTNTFTDNHALTFQKILPLISNNTTY
jgi:hypothetical protein